MNDSLFQKEIHVYKREYSVDVNEIIKYHSQEHVKVMGNRQYAWKRLESQNLPVILHCKNWLYGDPLAHGKYIVFHPFCQC